jgi:GNAT superfamily N-acetyltransferase
MPYIECTRTCRVEPTFRTHQVSGIFDLPTDQPQSESLKAEVPDLDDDWRLGAIVGSSGSGKTTIARAAYGKRALLNPSWNPRRAIVDQLGDHPIDSITKVLTSLGLGSVPTWLKPFHVLSCGEQFRCTLAHALLNSRSIVVCDEFANLLDRTLARNVSISIAREIRRPGCTKRFVAVTSHRDVLQWLQPDWSLDMNDQTLTWRRLRRPELRFAVHRCHRALWPRFARHHYLAGSLSCAAKCYAALENELPIAFCAVISLLGRPQIHRITRLVTLPDYQGLGIGGKLLDRVAQAERNEGYRVHITTSHPALVRFLGQSHRWRSLGRRFVTDGPRQIGNCPLRTSRGRFTESFEFTPPPASISAIAA